MSNLSPTYSSTAAAQSVRSSQPGLFELLGFLLAAFAAIALSPSTVDYLFLSFTTIKAPVGTYGFGAFLALTAAAVLSGRINRLSSV